MLARRATLLALVSAPIVLSLKILQSLPYSHGTFYPQEYARLKEEAGVKTAKLVEERNSLAASLEVRRGQPLAARVPWPQTSKQ